MDQQKLPVEKNLLIRRLLENETPPYDLLFLADPSYELIESYLERGICFVGELDMQIIGVYVLLETRPRTVEIMNIAVSEAEQGKGYGKQLVMHAITKARSTGYKAVNIGTGNSSINQLALYQKCGFRIIGVEIDYFLLNYPEAIYENGIQCRDMIRLVLFL